MQKSKFLSLLVLSLLLCTCSDNSSVKKPKDCSVAARCDNQADLAIRLLQVEIEESNETSSVIYLTQFDYNNSNQWIGGKTLRFGQTLFDYSIDYDDGKVSQLSKNFSEDTEDNTATEVLNYTYNTNHELQKIESLTEVFDKDNNSVNTIEKTIDYTFYVDGKLEAIKFSVDNSDPDIGMYSFSYEFIYERGRIKEIREYSKGNLDYYTFRTFSYNEEGKLSSSTSYDLNDLDEPVKQETTTYEYYIDGPLKRKTSLSDDNTNKVETVYLWEAGACATNQIFAEYFYPSPEVLNYPCF